MSGGRVYVIGSGGHAKVVVRTLQMLGHIVAAVFDDDPNRWTESLYGVPIVGPTERAGKADPLPAVIAVGDNAARKCLADKLKLDWMTIVHPRAFVDSSAHVEPGTVVLAGAVVQPDAWLGAHVIVNTSASVDHDCRICDYVHLAPGVQLAGGVFIGEGTLIGMGAVAIPGTRIGDWATIGAGTAVVSDLPPRVVAMGVPARPASRQS